VGGGWSGPNDFDGWVRPHMPAMSRTAAAFVGSDSVDDVVQEALVRAWKRSETFDPNRGSARAWLVAITARQGVRHRSRFRRLLAHHQRPEIPSSGSDTGADDEVRRRVAALPPRQREVIVWFYYVDLPVEVIAEILGISSGTVKSTLSDARSALARVLGETNNEH
jgi:RNA polymerase sigma factor (sigma-70 family)